MTGDQKRMEMLFVAEVARATSILPCFVGKETFSKRTSDDETNL